MRIQKTVAYHFTKDEIIEALCLLQALAEGEYDLRLDADDLDATLIPIDMEKH